MTRIFEFPELPGITLDLRRDLVLRSTQRYVSPGTSVFMPGTLVDALLIPLSGTLRVEQPTRTGGRIVLYRVNGGECCVRAIACLLADTTYATAGIAETDLNLFSLPKAAFDELIERSHEFRALIFQAYAKRIADLTRVMEDAPACHAAVPLDRGVIDLAGACAKTAATQQQTPPAPDIACEVVLRQSDAFQGQNWGPQGAAACPPATEKKPWQIRASGSVGTLVTE